MLKLITRAQSELVYARSMLRKFVKSESGASLIEYSVLIILITVLTIATIGLVGGKVSQAWIDLDTALTPVP